jgi:dynein heavy chain
LESQILSSLSDVKGNILDNEQLIIQLKQSKAKSIEISQRRLESEEKKVEIDQTRELYKSIAVRGSILYFVIADLANIEPTYQYSLSYFSKLFEMVISTSPQADTVDARIDILLKNITETIFQNVSRGLFNKDKLIFSLIVAI